MQAHVCTMQPHNAVHAQAGQMQKRLQTSQHDRCRPQATNLAMGTFPFFYSVGKGGNRTFQSIKSGQKLKFFSSKLHVSKGALANCH